MKKLLSIILSIALVFAMIPPVQSEADDGSAPWDGSVDLRWFTEQGGYDATDYYIYTPEELAGLAAIVNGSLSIDSKGKTPTVKGDKSLIQCEIDENFSLTGAQGGNQTDRVYLGLSKNDFTGKTIHIMADLDMGGGCSSDGTWSGPNWTPIGGKFPMDTRSVKDLKSIQGVSSYTDVDVHTIESIFNGVIDGHGHDITNLYCDRYTDKDFGNSMAIGLVGYMGEDYDNNPSEAPEGWHPAVKNLTLSGYIKGRRMVGGIVGYIGYQDAGTYVENCANYAYVTGTDSRGRGGIVGRGGSGLIVNCYNLGEIVCTFATSTGGIIGENAGMDIYNSYSAGKVSNTAQASYARGIGGHDEGTYEVGNCYYLEGSDGDAASDGYYKGTSTGIKVNVTALSESEMKGAGLVSSLNNAGEAFYADTENINGGYPVLYFQKEGYEESNVNVCAKDSGIYEGGTITLSCSGSVAYGTVIHISDSAEPEYILDCYKYNGNDLEADFVTATSDTEVSASFIKLEKGELTLNGDSNTYSISARKAGTVIKDGAAVNVTGMQIDSGDNVYQNDGITVKAVLKNGAKPEDVNKEYTGDFTYIFKYGDGTEKSNESGYLKLSDLVSEGISVTAVPKERNKEWVTRADTGWYDLSSSTYEIGSPEELAGLAYLVNEKGITFEGKTIKLTKNISLRNNDGSDGTRLWTVIGTSEDICFKGTFDGCGHTIYGMTVNRAVSYGGLFGYISGAAVKNLTLRGSVNAKGIAGSVAAYVNGGTIENCINYASVTSSGECAGGIAARIKGGSTIDSCINHGTVCAKTNYAGGITGDASEKADRIAKCVNFAAVSTEAAYAGGIAGRLTGSINECANYADIKAKASAGGIAGFTTGNAKAVISDAYNRGNVEATGTSSSGVSSAAGYAGGIAGYMAYVILENAYSDGTVTGAAAGAVAGYYKNSINNIVKNTYYTGSVPVYTEVKDENAKNGMISVSDMTDESVLTGLNGEKLYSKAGDGCPVLSFIYNLQSFTVTYTGDYEGSDRLYYGESAELPMAEPGYTYAFTSDGQAWSGECITCDETVEVSKVRTGFTAVFEAAGKRVGESRFEEGDTSIDVPEVPFIEGSTGIWSPYSIGAGNLLVTAVYTKNYIKGETSPASGYYYIDPCASGKITIGENENVILDGDSQELKGVYFDVRPGATLTLKNVYVNSSTTIVTVTDGTLRVEGENELIDSCTETDNLNPAVVINGSCTLAGSGSVYVKSSVGNYPLQINEGAALTQKSGTVMLYDGERTGKTGGIVNGPSGSLKISGGTFAAVSDTNKIYAVYVNEFVMTGGDAYILAADADERTGEKTYGKALYAEKMSVTGGNLVLEAKIHDTDNVYVYGEDCIQCDSFTSTHFEYTAELSTDTVLDNGKKIYEGSGLDTGYSIEDRKFISADNRKVHLWLTDGTHTMTVNGKKVTATNDIGKFRITLSNYTYAYTGKAHKPVVTVKGLTKGTDYTVSYSSYTSVGKGKVTIKGTGKYSGSITKTFTINPPATAIRSISKGKKCMTVYWTKKTKQVTGYQIRYSRYSSMKSAKTISVSSYKTGYKKISKLTSGKKYYVKVRTYKKIGSSYYYSGWSKVKYTTVK